MYRSLAYVVAAASLMGCVEQQNDMPSEEEYQGSA